MQVCLSALFVLSAPARGLRVRTRPDDSLPIVLPLQVERELWASGFDFKTQPESTLQQGQVWTWQEETVKVFQAIFDEVQNPCDCNALPVALADKAGWGLTSRIRDFEDVLLGGMMAGLMTLNAPLTSHGSDFKCLYKDNRADPFMNCIFQPFSRCQAERRNSTPKEKRHRWKELYDSARFYRLVSNWWTRLQQAGLRLRDTKSEVLDFKKIRGVEDGESNKTQKRGELELEPKLSNETDTGHRRLGVLRALLASVSFQPSELVNRRLMELEHALARPEGLMLVVHVRRTDKNLELPGSFKHNSSNGVVDLSAIFALIKLAETAIQQNYTSFYLISDDPSVFQEPKLSMLRAAFAANAVPLYNPYVVQSFAGDSAWRARGHAALATHTTTDIELMADIFYAAEHGTHLVGCGRSGISQLIAQKLGAKLKIDPNVLTLFEDDRALLKNVLGEAAALRHVNMMTSAWGSAILDEAVEFPRKEVVDEEPDERSLERNQTGSPRAEGCVGAPSSRRA